MTRNQKQEMIAYLRDEFSSTSALLICDYKGTNVKSLEQLRAEAKKINAKVQVIKNTLARIAIKDSNHPDLEIKDTNVFVWGDDQIALSKVVVKFTENNAEKFSIKIGSFKGEKVDSKQVVSVSKLPSKEELIGMLLSVWTAPARYFATGLDNLRRQKEQQ